MQAGWLAEQQGLLSRRPLPGARLCCTTLQALLVVGHGRLRQGGPALLPPLTPRVRPAWLTQEASAVPERAWRCAERLQQRESFQQLQRRASTTDTSNAALASQHAALTEQRDSFAAELSSLRCERRP